MLIQQNVDKWLPTILDDFSPPLTPNVYFLPSNVRFVNKSNFPCLHLFRKKMVESKW